MKVNEQGEMRPLPFTTFKSDEQKPFFDAIKEAERYLASLPDEPLLAELRRRGYLISHPHDDLTGG